MCIIVYKPAGEKFPAKNILKNCFMNNPDGAGFMWSSNGGVNIRKGFETFNAFYKALNTARAKYPDAPYVLHFRISTQGGVRPDCCHPFPLSECMDDLRQLKTRCNIGIAHNGIIDITSRGWYSNITYSDTMEFITDYLALIIRDENYYTDEKTLKLIERLASSKLAIMDGAGHCEIIGEWETAGGCMYSNGSYKAAPRKTYKKYKASTPPAPLYDFNALDCPAMVDGDYQYCTNCKHLEACWTDTEIDYLKGGNLT